MNRELEALLLVYDAAFEARDVEAGRLMAKFEDLVDVSWEREKGKRPGLSRASLRNSIVKAHARWARASARNPSAIPPTA